MPSIPAFPLSLRSVAAAGWLLASLAGRVDAQLVAGPYFFNGKSYYLTGPHPTWNAAENYARSQATHLVRVDTPALDQFLFSTFFPLINDRIYIGFTDQGSEGVWHWSDGVAGAYTNWRTSPHEPNGGTSENYCEYTPTGTWNDCCGCTRGYGIVELQCPTDFPHVVWVGDPQNNHDGVWSNGAMWSPAGVPAPAAVAEFQTLTHNITFVRDETIAALDLTDSTVTLRLDAHTLTQSACYSGTGIEIDGLGSLYIENGVLDIHSAVIVRGDPTFDPRIRVSDTGTLKALEIRSLENAVVRADGANSTVQTQTLRIGGAGVGGSASVHGGAMMSVTGAAPGLLVGDAGHWLFITGQDCRTDARVVTVTTTGELSVLERGTLSVSETLKVNAGGAYAVDIRDAGLIEAPTIVIGDTSEGLLELRSGAKLHATGIGLNKGLVIGGAARGRLFIDTDLNNVELRLSQLTLGQRSGGTGQLDLLSGETLELSAVNSEFVLTIGDAGEGTLNVHAGATLRIPAHSIATVGGEPGSNGLLTVDGASARFEGDERSGLLVGTTTGSRGRLDIKNGGELTVGTLSAGYGLDDQTGTSFVVLDNASLNAQRTGATPGNGGLLVGSPAGTGYLTAVNGSVIWSTAGVVAGSVGQGPGALPGLSLSHSNWFSGPLRVAGANDAFLLVGIDSLLTSGDAQIGHRVFGRGTVRIVGPSLAWVSTGAVRLGDGTDASRGTLVCADGGQLRCRRFEKDHGVIVEDPPTGQNPVIQVGGGRTAAVVQTDLLGLAGVAEEMYAGLDLSFGPGAGLAGHGSLDRDFECDFGGAVAAEQVPFAPGCPDSLAIGGHYFQGPEGTLDVSCGVMHEHCVSGVQIPVRTALHIDGVAQLQGALRISQWVAATNCYHPALDQHLYESPTFEILTATAVVGAFDRIEFAPGFPTDQVEVTYEPGRVLVTIMPPRCFPIIDTQPSGTYTGPGGTAVFTIHASADPDHSGNPVIYQWQHYFQNDGFMWTNANDQTYLNGGYQPIYAISGAYTDTLTVIVNPAFLSRAEGEYRNPRFRCVAYNDCASRISNEAGLNVCAADFNADAFLDFFDFQDFTACFEGQGCPPDKDADFNLDGFADFFDFNDFVGAFEAGC